MASMGLSIRCGFVICTLVDGWLSCQKLSGLLFECTLNRLTKEFVRTVPNTDPPPETDIVGLRKININGVDINNTPDNF